MNPLFYPAFAGAIDKIRRRMTKSAPIKEGDKNKVGACNSIRSKDLLSCHACNRINQHLPRY